MRYSRACRSERSALRNFPMEWYSPVQTLLTLIPTGYAQYTSRVPSAMLRAFREQDTLASARLPSAGRRQGEQPRA